MKELKKKDGQMIGGRNDMSRISMAFDLQIEFSFLFVSSPFACLDGETEHGKC